MPDRNAEYLLYQILLGAWPIDAERATAYLLKAAREAKAHTSWTDGDQAYEDGDQGVHLRLCWATGDSWPTWEGFVTAR